MHGDIMLIGGDLRREGRPPALGGRPRTEQQHPAEPDPVAIGPVVTLPIAHLAGIDSPRLEGIDPDHVRALAALAAGRLPPIVVHHGSMRVLDGAHRLAAAKLNGRETIEARLFQGEPQEAFELSVRLNLSHGLSLSARDRRAAAARMLREQPQTSDRAIAAATGLAPGTVADIRLVLGPESEARDRVGLDGRARPLNAAEGRERARLALIANPEASLRQVARAAGVSVGTVRDVRRRLFAAEHAASEPEHDAQRSAAQAPGAPPVDVDGLFRGLSRDPTLRYTEHGRQLLRWLERRMLLREQWHDVPAQVPPHCAGIVADIARACAASWSSLAERLEVASE